MIMLPKVTVLMTVYNGDAYLRECIESVLCQSFRDFEFLIIDDCSTDSTIDVIKFYNDPRIRLVVNKENMRQVRSLNIGLDLAKGKYIARIDQDDVMLKDRLGKQVDFLDNNPEVSVVGCWGRIIDENGKVFVKSQMPVKNEEIIGTVLFAGWFLMHPSVLFRKKDILDLGKYDENMPFTEDYDMWTRLLLKGYRLANIPSYLIKFRYHKKSSSRQFSDAQLDNLRKTIHRFIKTVTASDDKDMGNLCDMLVNTGLMNRNYWSNEFSGRDAEKVMDLLGRLLEKTVNYFGLGKRQAYTMKKVFLKRMLNFAYEGSSKDTKNLPLYLFCLKNYPYVFTRPKLYLYPIRAFI